MAKRLKKGGVAKVLRVKVLGSTTAMCAVLCAIGAHRVQDFEYLTQGGEMLAVEAGENVQFLNPVRGISTLPRESVEVLGFAEPAPAV